MCMYPPRDASYPILSDPNLSYPILFISTIYIEGDLYYYNDFCTVVYESAYMLVRASLEVLCVGILNAHCSADSKK